jgi:hypothetical protein
MIAGGSFTTAGGKFAAYLAAWTKRYNCTCACHADPECDGAVDALDVVHAVNVAFRAGLPIPDPNALCWFVTTDVTCDGFTDVLDVVHLVNVAFRGADPATEFCDPCAP